MKRTTKKILAAAVCLVFVLTMLVACGAQQAAAPAAETKAAAAPSQEAPKQEATKAEAPKAEAASGQKMFRATSPDEMYMMNVMVSGVEYWFPVYEMFKEAAHQVGAKAAYTGTPDYDVNKQIATFEQDLVKKPAGIMVHPMNSDAFIEPINKAIDSGIPVVTFAADSPKSKRRVYITSDNVYEGNYGADYVANLIGKSGKIMTCENPGQDNHTLYINTFKKRIADNWKDCKIVQSIATNQDPNKAYQAVLTVYQANPDLKAVATAEANSGMGAGQAAKEIGGGKVKVLTRDCNAKILDMIKAGDMTGAINPDQGNQGYFGFLALFVSKHTELFDPMSDYMITKNNPVQLPFINNGLTIIDKGNVDAFYWDKYLARRGTKGIEEN